MSFLRSKKWNYIGRHLFLNKSRSFNVLALRFKADQRDCGLEVRTQTPYTEQIVRKSR
jgi:hypothetical protein